MQLLEAQLSTAFAGQSFKSWKPGQLLDFVKDTIADIIDGFNLDEMDDEDKAAILAAVGNAYDKYIAPLDIPYVPAFVEGYLDDVIWRFICGWLCQALEYDGCDDHDHGE